jgi:tetratricopeptide (TPR) repeat protein
VRLFTEAIKADPADLNAFLHRAFCLNILKRYDEAIIDLTVVIDREPTHALAYTTRGSSYLKAGKPELALADLEKVISLDPRNEEAWNNIGWARKATGDMAAACKAWRTSQRMGNGEAKIILTNNRCK